MVVEAHVDLQPCRPATVFDFRQPLARGRAHALTEGKCWRFYPPAAPLQAALRLAPLIIPMIDLIQSARLFKAPTAHAARFALAVRA